MALAEEKIEAKIRFFFREWSKKYRADFREEEPYTCVYDNKSFLKDQIEFIRQYLGLMLIDGSTIQNLKRIERFLAMQTALNNDDAMMQLHFHGGSPIEVKIIIKSIVDVDVADVFAITGFQSILVCKGKNKRWTQKSSKLFIKALEDDLAFDGFKGRFNYKFCGNELEMLNCRIK